MSKHTKYRLYEKYETRGSQEAIPCYPNVFSIDADGTMPVVVVEEDSRDCGGGSTDVQYRWVNLPITQDYYCDECDAPTPEYRWVDLPITQYWVCDECEGPEPSDFKWIATYSDGHTESAACDSSSAITSGEITKNNLVSVEIGECVKGIRDDTFMGAANLKVTFNGNNFTYFGDMSFGNCNNLDIVFPEGLIGFDYFAFYWCQFKNRNVTIPSTVTHIGKQAFEYSNVDTFTFLSLTPPSLGDRALHVSDSFKPNILVPCEAVATYKAEWPGYADVINGIPPCETYENQYLTLVAKGNGAFGKIYHSGTFQYSKNEGQTWTNATSSTTISVSNGDRVMFKGELTPSESIPYGIGTFSASTQFEAEGNPMSLLYGDNFIGKKSLSEKNYALYSLFSGCTNLISIENLALPATTLARHCYSYMFSECTSLTSVPSDLLPATTLASYCYFYMFAQCSLTTVPQLPATTLAIGCYSGMFAACESLTTAPELPALNLAEECYSSMFLGCKKLTTAPQLPATTLANKCYDIMFAYCTSLTTAPELPALNLAEECYSSMFQGCESLRTAPVLPATTLTEQCYEGMFIACSRLNYVKCLATDISAYNCTGGWLYNVSSSGTFVKKSSMSGWTRGTSGIPNNWTIKNA